MQSLIFVFYSLLRAITGSRLAAKRLGIIPAISVSTTLIVIRTIPPSTGSDATPGMPASALIIRLIGISKSTVIIIPIAPDIKPIIIVSALNTRDTSRLDAPSERRMPISLVRSSTEM